jgi:hypothetical protein
MPTTRDSLLNILGGNPKNLIINKNITPWNVYGSMNNPNYSLPSNVLIAKKEWYNSFTPPFFDLSDIEIVTEIKQHIDNNKSLYNLLKSESIGFRYKKHINRIFSESTIQHTISNLSKRVALYFNLEKKLISLEPSGENKVDLLAYLYVGVNLYEFFMGPVEAFVLGKPLPGINLKKRLYKSNKNLLKLLEKSVPIELVFIPLALQIESKTKNNSYNKVFTYLYESLMCTAEDLEFGLKHADNKYKYGRYLDSKTAANIIEIAAGKIDNLLNAGPQETVVNKIQTIGGIMTWSKYILTQKNPLRFRYDSASNILDKTVKQDYIFGENIIKRQDLETETTAGAEKQGKINYLLYTLIQNSEKLRSQILERSDIYLQDMIK